MQKIGLILNNFASSQLAYFGLTNEVPENFNLFGFYQNIANPIVEPKFPLYHCFELYNFDGYLISTDVSTTQQMLKTFSAKQKIFYIWDIEWLRYKNRYEAYREVYCNPELTLVTRCDDYKRLIESLWRRECRVIENVNYNEFVNRIFV